VHSMTYSAADHLARTALSSPPPHQGSNHLLGGISGGTVLVLGVAAWAIIKLRSNGVSGDTAAHGGRGLIRALISMAKGIGSAFGGLYKALRAVLRFVGGRELWGKPKSTATFLGAGTRLTTLTDQAPATALGSVALAPPKVSLVKRQPSPWARKTAAWLAGYHGRAERALDVTVRTALWTARTTTRAYKATRTAYRAVAPVVATIARTLGNWHCWPYAARGLARLLLLALLAAWLIPAWTTWTLLAALTAAGLLAALARRLVPTRPGDDAVYGPRLWVILRQDLKLPEDEPRERWLHLPQRLSDPGARIVLRLPSTFRGSELERQQVTELINSRLPGEWVGRYSFTGEECTAVYTHKPPATPKVEPECPEMVDFFDPEVQDAIAACAVGEVVLGRDQHHNIVTRRLDGETPHWALSVGTGGGKSTFNVSVAVQLIAQGFHIIVADVKRSSVKPLEGIPGVYIYNDPSNPQDMRAAIEWFKEEIDARSYVKNRNPEIEFPGLLLLIEESNEFADVSREWWDDNRKTSKDEFGPADRAADPIWGEVASAARLGRFVRGNILAVFQDLRDQALGGKGLRNLFRLKFMGNYNVNQWKNVIGTTPVPESVDKAGRMMIVEGNSHIWVQTLYGPGSDLHDWAMQRRQEQGFDPAAGLFGTPPERSAERLPSLLRGLSRDDAASGPLRASEGGLEDETAGRLSHNGPGVTALDGDVTASRDRLRLIPGEGGQEPADDPTAPPELLPLAEVARRVGPDQGVPKYDTLRQHKARRDDFPKGIEINGKEHFTVAQIVAYYTPKENRA